MFHCFKIRLIKPKELLVALNSINPAIQFTMETSDTQFPFLDIMINKEGKKAFMIFTHFLKNISSFLARRICMITEKDSLKENNLKELERLLLEQHYPERIIKARIKKALKYPKTN